MKRILAFIFIQIISVDLTSAQQPKDNIPDWVREEWEFLVQGSGTWIADNSKYKTEDNSPNDAFGLKWEYGLGKKSLKGRLYGIVGDKEEATFWEFRIFWHPKEQRIIAEQFGANGTYGVGSQKRIGDNETEMWQEFFNPDGSSSKVGHRAKSIGKEHITDSFNIDENGIWSARRSYTWKLKED